MKVQLSLTQKQYDDFLKIAYKTNRNYSQTLVYLCEVYLAAEQSNSKEVLELLVKPKG